MIKKTHPEMKVTLIDPNLYCASSPNIGLAYIISSAEARHKISLIDLTFHSYNWLSYAKEKLRHNPPDVVGISVTTFSFTTGLKIASLVKQLYPGVPVIFGGVHPTLLPEETINHSGVDAICIGEGEEAFLEYLSCLQNHLVPKGVMGIWYKEGDRVVKNLRRPFKEDLDSLPFPNWDYWEVEKYMKTNGFFVGTLTILASRGCPYDCAFCSNPAIQKAVPGRYYRLRSAENIIEEIKVNKKRYWKLGFRNISFGDEIFGLDSKQLDGFCNTYIEEKLNEDFSWTCGIRADLVNDPWAKKVAHAGCVMVYLGIESGDDYIRIQVYKKGITYQQIVDSARHLQNNNIVYQFSMMVGCQEETRETIEKSRQLVKELNPVMVHFSYYLPLPKTELAQRTKNDVSVDGPNLSRRWNILRMKLPSRRVKYINKIVWSMRIDELIRFFKRGIELKGLVFFLDIIKYVFWNKDLRVISLTNPYVRIDLARKTIHRYMLESWRQKQVSVYKADFKKP